jgi:EAL domain-containing protein (putative c-di-GMP-specific phosphodiesterase class I)
MAALAERGRDSDSVTPSVTSARAATSQSNRLHPSSLHLELTEQALMGDETGPLAVLTKLHRLGVRIALDDFGTGYWNLPDLRRLPLHELKLAGSFAVGLQSPCPVVDQRIVAALVDLAHALELTVTAEGIETPAQLERFREVGCDVGQGSLFAPPGAAEQIDALFRAASPLCDISRGTSAGKDISRGVP